MRVQPLAVPSGPAALRVLDELVAAAAGTGPLLVPHAPGDIPDVPVESALPGAIAVGTSGSTGTPKRAVLTAKALAASIGATHHVLGGPGRWLLALPAHHIAGLQVLLRSSTAGFTPATLGDTDGFTPQGFARSAAAMAPAPRRYTSLVPTQLRRLLADDVATDALAGFDAVLVGGAASAAGLLTAARAAGVRVVTTYGMSETAGGCVYDGVALPVSRVRLGEDGRIMLGGATLASGYLTDGPGAHPADAAFTRDDEGGRWFRTDDVGHLEPAGDTIEVATGRATSLVVDGRADDAVVTGGLKVMPRVVEDALHAVLPPGAGAVVLGVPDEEWGQVVGAALTPPPGTGPHGVSQLQESWRVVAEELRERLPPSALPRRVVVLPELPLRGPGKPDRPALRALLAAARVGQ